MIFNIKKLHAHHDALDFYTQKHFLCAKNFKRDIQDPHMEDFYLRSRQTLQDWAAQNSVHPLVLF